MQWCSRGRELERSIEHRALMSGSRPPLPLETGSQGGGHHQLHAHDLLVKVPRLGTLRVLRVAVKTLREPILDFFDFPNFF